MGSKYLELLKAVAPGITRAGMMFNPKSAPGGGSYFYDPFVAAASVFSVHPEKGEVQSIVDIDEFITKLARENGGLVVIGEPFTNMHRAKIMELTTRYRMQSRFASPGVAE